MRHQNSVFHQLLQWVPWQRFDTLVEDYGADKRVRALSTKSQFIALLHAKLSGAVSLRDIETTLASHRDRLYHLGASEPARSTLSDANKKRPAALFADLFGAVLKQVDPGLRRHAREALHLIDATSIRLSDLSLDWADYARHGAIMKMHIDYRADKEVPVHFEVTPARVHDITPVRHWTIESGSTYVFDLGYYDFAWFAKLNAHDCRFVTRLKSHTRPRVLAEMPVADGGAIRADRHVAIDGRLASMRARLNPLKGLILREIVVVIETGTVLRLLTNDLAASAEEIADIYKARWQVELFFRWVKQNLKIKRFIGVSENAIRIQIAVALIAYLLLRLASAAQSKAMALLTFTRLIRANLMRLRPITDLEHPPPPTQADPRQAAFAWT